MSEIKNCPICNGKAEVFVAMNRIYPNNVRLREKRYGVLCKKPHCLLLPANFKTEEEAIEAWNGRDGNNE